MYFYRLLDCLKEDYPATLAVMGATNFHNLITGYLLAYPPSHPSVLYAGRHLADFLDSHPLRDEWPFIADLACLERALIEIFHGRTRPRWKLASFARSRRWTGRCSSCGLIQRRGF